MNDSAPPRPGASAAVPTRWLTLWALLIPIAYAPSLLVGGGPHLRGLAAIGAMTALALLAVRALVSGRSLDRLAAAIEPRARALLLMACAVYLVGSVAASARGLARFGDYPMAAIFSQSTWTLLHGLPFANSHETVDGTLVSHFGLHCSPTLLLVAPFYALWPGPLTLMVAQALALALAPIPLFALLRPRVGGTAALGLALGLLAFPLFVHAGQGDFHDSCLLPAPLLATVWALETRRRGWLAFFAVLSLGVREDVAITIAVLGLYAWRRGLGVRTALALIALSAVWFVGATRLLMPVFWKPGIYMDSARFFEAAFGHWGATPLAAARGVLAHPLAVVRWLTRFELAHYAYTLLLPLLLLPPFLDLVAFVALPGLALNLLSRYSFMHTADAPYNYVPVTFLVLAVAGLAARIAGRSAPERRAAAGVAVAIVVLAGVLPGTFAPTWSASKAPLPPAAVREVMRLIPPDAAVYAPVELYPAMCNRTTYNCYWNTTGVPLNAAFRARHAYIVLWPPGDPPGIRRDSALSDSLATDPAFARLPGFTPFEVYRRR